MRDTNNQETDAIDRPGSNWKLRFIVLASCLLMAVASCAFLRISKVSDLRTYVDMATSSHLFGNNLLCASSVPATLPISFLSAFLPHAVRSLEDTAFIHSGMVRPDPSLSAHSPSPRATVNCSAPVRPVVPGHLRFSILQTPSSTANTARS